jgi:hypothetical protein
MKARIRPISQPHRLPMFDRLVMNVIAMAFKIPLIADLLFPPTMLLDGLLAFVPEGSQVRGFESVWVVADEIRFDQQPAG